MLGEDTRRAGCVVAWSSDRQKIHTVYHANILTSSSHDQTVLVVKTINVKGTFISLNTVCFSDTEQMWHV